MSRRPRRTGDENRAIVLATATELFYFEGIHAVGVERIAQAAEVAPATLYRAFASKDELVEAYVQDRDDAWRRWFLDRVESADDARGAIVAVVAGALERVRSEDYRGCPFQMALAEFPNDEHPAHRAAVANKQWMCEQFAALCADLEPAPDAALADELCVVLDGLYASAHDLGSAGPAATTVSLVERLLDVSSHRTR